MASDVDVAALVANADLLDSPRVVSALEDFIVEAIDEATEILRHGDMTSRTTLIRTILSMALKAKDSTGTNDAEAILAQTRAAVAEVLE